MNQKYVKKLYVIVLALALAAGSLQTAPLSAAQAAAESSYRLWNENEVYQGGDIVSYQGNLYQAKWWTQGDVPGAGGEWGVWTFIGVDTGNPTDPTDPTNPGDVIVGELTDQQINEIWGGIHPNFSPEAAQQRLEKYLSENSYEELFPRRFGSPGWYATNPSPMPGFVNEDYYSYHSLKEAINEVANLKIKVDYREGVTYTSRTTVLNKTTKVATLVSVGPDFNASWNLSKPISSKIVDFGTFLAEGSENDKKREIAAFLANIAHETSGGWATAPGGMYAWGLYFNEEVGHINSNSVGYVDSMNAEFPPVPGKSYHGRGPIQLSWNYNYGLFSGIIYQDKNILLNNPDLVEQDGKLGFMTALLFWMTPQSPKPSCHDIIVGNWSPTQEDLNEGRIPCFGLTIVVINGGYEANKDESDYRVGRRAGHYRDITSKNGADISGEKLDTLGMLNW